MVNIFSSALFGLSLGFIAVITTHGLHQGQGSHPCVRDCTSDRPEVCEYNFTVEWYYLLSKACHECPFKPSDCFRPQCVSGDGKQRPVLTVNRQMPGPSIEVCRGDTVRVWVENKMEDGSSSSIHWHGVHQDNSCFMDGVGQLTQCNIPAGELFKYEFRASNAGTHWYHSHTAMQFGDGLLGPFIVRDPRARDPASALYDEDRSDHIIVLQDWHEQPVLYNYLEEMDYLWPVPLPLASLINGRGRRYLFEDKYNIWGHKPAYTPYEVFNVTSGTRYRFRLIGAAARCYYKVSVDGHNLVVIASDGQPLKPVTVDALMIHSGERYDFILTADKTPGSYWIRARGYGDCVSNKADALAILQYDGDNSTQPTGLKNATRTGVVLNPDPVDQTSGDIPVQSLQYGRDGEDFTTEKVDVQYYMTLHYLNNDNTRYNDPVLYPVKQLPTRMEHLTPTLNNITNYIHPIPLLTQWNDIADKNLCNGSSFDTTRCDDDLCYCTHMLEAKLGQVVELFIVSNSDDAHPMHLHGFSFRVVGFGPFEDKVVDIGKLVEDDQAGRYPRSLTGAHYRDTVSIYKGTYGIIRFVASNPGVWFFHCHNEGHLMQGMALTIKVGDVEDFPPAPAWFPRCGGYNYYRRNERENQEKLVSSAPVFPVLNMQFLLLVTVIVVQFGF